MKIYFAAFILLVAAVQIHGWEKYKRNALQKPRFLIKSLRYLASHVRQVIRKYEKEHWIRVKGKYIPRKKNLAYMCKQKIRKENLSVRDRANKVLEIMHIFMNQLQQIQIDESSVPRGSFEIISALRHLEYELRDISESAFRTVIRKNFGRVAVPYTIGKLPASSSCYGCRPKTVRSINVLQLHMLLSCISDISHVANNQLFGLLYGSNSTKNKYGRF